MSYERFMEVKGRAKRGLDGKFNWSDDGCSPSWTPAWLYRNLFEKQCKQHDFGYRNFGSGSALGRNEDTRVWIDGRFKTEMRRRCAKFTGLKAANGVTCRSDANIVYDGVRGTTWGRGAYYKPISDPKRTLVGHIVQWDRDKKRQKTAWLVDAEGKRRWIPSSADYNCFKERGHLGPTVLRADTLDNLPDRHGLHATCATLAPLPPPEPAPPPATVAPPPPPAQSAPTPQPPTPEPLRRVITVYNKLTNGPTQMREDPIPVRLTTKPWKNCGSRGCNINGTERSTGQTYDAAICWTTGDLTTNGNNNDSVDASNPNRYSSNRYYKVRLGNGTTGFVSWVWIHASQRGGWGLPGC
jgi:hypothetical protein